MVDTPGHSRPNSAYSDASFATALERSASLDHAASLTHGIDRIITLLSNSRHSLHHRSASIASQASIERNSNYPSVSQTYILQELELLKEQFTNDQYTARRPFSISLENTSQQDHDTDGKHDTTDINVDKELETQREKLFLRAAERRVDGLTTNNASLQQQLETQEREIDSVKAQKDTLDLTLQDAKSDISKLETQLQQVLQSSQEQQKLIEELRSEKQRSDSAYEDGRSGKSSVSGSKEEGLDEVRRDNLNDQTQKEVTPKKSRGKSRERSRSVATKSGRSGGANLDLEKQLAEVELLLIDLEGKKARNDALAKQVEEYQSKLEVANREKEVLERQSHETKSEHAQAMHDLRAQIDTERQQADTTLADVKSAHARVIETQKDTHAQELEKLRTKHAENASSMTDEHSKKLENSEEALLLSKSRESALENQIQELSAALEAYKASPRQPAEVLTANTREQSTINLDRQISEEEVQSLKQRHQEAIAQIRANAQKQLDDQRIDLEQIHQAEMASALAQAAERSAESPTDYQSKISRLEGEHRLRMAELGTQHQEKITLELLLKEDAIKSDMKALQDRLDASLSGQAEAERSIALCRQQKLEAEKRLADTEAKFAMQFEESRRENDDLTVQLKRSQSSLHELEQNNSKVKPTTSTHAKQELNSTKAQLNNLEKSRAEAHALWQKALDEKSELIRQNDFLVKELEALLTQRSKPRSTNSSRRDVSIQTDEHWPLEPKAAGMRQWKDERQHVNPPRTPVSPSNQQVRNEIEMAWEMRTFEQYEASNGSEFPGLERSSSANQALFAGKLQEHMSDMQNARHQIAVDYQAKLNNLASEKDKMDRMVTSSHIAAFAEEHEKLVASLSVAFDNQNTQTPPVTPIDEVMEMRAAEQRLVQEYDRRLVERKSQIALQYAAKFQNMTQDYDMEIAGLLHSGWPLGPSSTPRPQSSHKSVRSVKSVRTNDDDHGDSRPPPVTPDMRSNKTTSTPRNSTSIPRAVMYPGNRHSPDATSQPRSATKAFHRNWNSVAQHSLMRAKSPAGILKTPSSITSEHSADAKSISSPLRERFNPPEVPEQPQQQQQQQQQQQPENDNQENDKATGKALSRLSMESSIPGPGIPTRAKKRQSFGITNSAVRSKSMRHSSGMIYYHIPRQSVANASS